MEVLLGHLPVDNVEARLQARVQLALRGFVVSGGDDVVARQQLHKGRDRRGRRLAAETGQHAPHDLSERNKNGTPDRQHATRLAGDTSL